MNRDIKILGSENDRTKYISNRDSSYVNGMTDFIAVNIPASRVVCLKRACEVFDHVGKVPELSWLKMTDSSCDIVEKNRMTEDEMKKTWGQTIGKLLAEGQVLHFDTPFGQRNLRAKHVYNAVACSLNEDSDMTSSSFYAVAFWSNNALSNYICRIFFGTSGVYL
jgi:hypothetical protein